MSKNIGGEGDLILKKEILQRRLKINEPEEKLKQIPLSEDFFGIAVGFR